MISSGCSELFVVHSNILYLKRFGVLYGITFGSHQINHIYIVSRGVHLFFQQRRYSIYIFSVRVRARFPNSFSTVYYFAFCFCLNMKTYFVFKCDDVISYKSRYEIFAAVSSSSVN